MERPTKPLRELKKDYYHFLEYIPVYLKKLRELLGKEFLDFSQEEVKQVVDLYLKYYKRPEKLDLAREEFNNMIDAYLGTAFAHYHGGHWWLNTSKSDLAYGTPNIIEYGPKGHIWVRINPREWRSSIERYGNWDDSIKRIFRVPPYYKDYENENDD